MVSDKPSWQKGWELEYGSLQPDGRRYLTEQEIVWNEELIEEEAATAGPRGSASAATASLGCVVAAEASDLLSFWSVVRDTGKFRGKH